MISPRSILARMSAMPSSTSRAMTNLSSSLFRSSVSSSKIQTSSFSSTAAPMARKKQAARVDSRLQMIRYHLQHPKTPRPLRFSRMRALRHWTIHRAWLLFQRKQKEDKEGELLRMFQSMHGACEALRTVQGPGEATPGRLYRIAMGKQGVYGPGGVPIEYARAQTETPAREAWNHGWKR